jgi:excisionase family DNA binding protein
MLYLAGMSTQPDKLAVDIREAAQMLSVSPRTIQNYIRAKMLPARKIGRRTVVSIRALEIFLRTDHPSPSGIENDAVEFR